MSNYCRWTMTSAIALCAASGLAGQASAQTVERVGAVEEIVVTALKGNRTVQETPATVLIVAPDRVQGAAAMTMDDLRSVVSGVNFTRTGDRSPTVSVRGLGSAPSPNTNEPSVGLFVDGIYAPRQREFQAALFDLSNLEVIKGTQAVALGRNTSLGALNLVTRKPGRVFAYNAGVSHEFNLNSTIVDLGVDLPVGDNLAIRVAGQFADEGGWVKEIITGKDLAHRKIRHGRITSVWTPTEKVEVLLSAEAEHYKAIGAANEVITTNPAFPNGVASAFGYLPSMEYKFDYRTASYSPLMGVGSAEVDTNRLRADVTWRVGDFRLRSLAGYSFYAVQTAVNNSFLPGNANPNSSPSGAEQWSEELRLQSPEDAPFQYSLGGSYLRSIIKFRQINIYDYPTPFPAGGRNGTLDSFFKQYTETYSIFGDMNWQLTESVAVIAGLRHSFEDKRAVYGRFLVAPGNIVNSNPVFPLTPLAREEDSTDGSAALQYKFKPGMMTYVSYGRGTKAGGFSGQARVPAEASYLPEVAQTIEAGVKISAGSRYYIDAAVFDTKVKDFQVSVLGANNLATFVGVNLASRGVDLQGQWSPVPVLQFNGGATYAEAENRANGATLPRAPKWTANAEARLQQKVGSGLLATAAVSTDYRSRFVHHLVTYQGAFPASESLLRFNAEVGVSDPESGWSLKLVGRNLTNEKAFGSSQALPVAPAGTSFVIIPEQPRAVSLELKFQR